MPRRSAGLVVEISRLARCGGTLDCVDIILREIGDCEHLPVSTLQPVVLLGRKQDCALPPVASHRDRYRQSHILIAAEVFLKFGR